MMNLNVVSTRSLIEELERRGTRTLVKELQRRRVEEQELKAALETHAGGWGSSSALSAGTPLTPKPWRRADP
jgi:hypothetical protein